nr:insulin-like receptor 1 [Porcellio dilatatus petiti]
MSFLPSFVMIFTILKITSCGLLSETPSEEVEYHYCESQNIFGDEIEVEFKNLKRCHVIEGHLRLHRLALPEGASLPNLTQVTDYIILERLEGLESLAVLFPRLSVIRGQNLFFDKYALVLHGNLELEEIGPWILSSIMHGAVHVESNIFLCTEEEIDWDMIRPSYRRFNFFRNNLDFCPFMGCEKEGYCNVRDKTCKTLGLSCPNITLKNCSSECIGGCYKASDSSACVACKNFQYFHGNVSRGIKKCVKKCPAKHLNYMNYRCITYDECHRKNYSVLDPKDTAFLDEGIMSPEDLSDKGKMYRKHKNDMKCIKDCPEKFIHYHEKNANSQKKMRFCKLRRVCETTIITNNNLGENLKYCNHVDGNLIIFVARGKNVTQQLEENLKLLETVSGYVKVAGADAIYSLSFLSNLKRIEGKEVVNGGEYHEGYSFYLVENSNLKELWDCDFRSKELHINGSVYIHFNDRLCDSEIEKFRQIANIKDGKISNHTNGINAPCNIFHTHLNAVPGSRNGTIILSWMHNYCAVDSRYVYGYQVFYRPVNKNISKYQGRDVCNDNRLFKRNVAELKVVHEPVCMEMELKCLTPNTRYAIYVESLAVDNIKYQIESSIVYATTYNDNIEKPRKEKLELTNDGISISWEHPKVPSYIVPEEIFYEIILTLDGDPTQDLFKVGATSVQEPEDCLCSSLSKDTYFIKKQIKESIAIENEISSLLFRRRKNNTLFRSREKRSPSSSQTYEEHDTTCGLKSYRISSASKYKKKACQTNKSNSSDCQKPNVEWSSSSLKFKKSIVTSSWKVKDDVYSKAMKTENKTIFINLTNTLSTMPMKISVEIRACVGEIRPCPPLHSEESCSICSDFLSFVTLTSLPKFQVDLWDENDSNNSGHKPHHVPCKETSTYVDISSLHIVDEIATDRLIDDESSNGSVMPFSKKGSSQSLLNISWTEPMDLLNFILGYRILYYNMDNSEKAAVRTYISKSDAQKMENRFKISVETSSMKYVGFQIHYQGGYGEYAEKCLKILQNESSGYLIYLIWCGFVALGALSMAAVFKFSKEIWTENSHSKSGKKSCEYSSKLYAIFRRFDARFRVEPGELDVNVNEKLGSGCFGNIYKGTVTIKDGDNSTDTTVIPVAVKIINHDRKENSRPQAFDELLEEGFMMQKFDCFFVVKLIAIDLKIIFEHPSLCIAMEYLDTDLKDYITHLKVESLSEKEMVEILSQVSIGMSYLHDNHFIHRDLAARNCLVQQIGTGECYPLVVKVADFGLARNLDEDYMYVQAAERLISVRWTSPEALANSVFHRECDVWSFGVLIYEIVTKCVEEPYDDGTKKYTEKELKELIRRKKVTLKLPSDRPTFFRLLMGECLEFHPEARPTFTEIVHKLLSSGIPTDDFVTWCESHSHLHKCVSVDSKSDSFNDDNYISASTLEPCDNEMDDESDFDDNACLAPKECGRNQSSCLSINCVHNTIFCRKKRFSKSEIDDLSFRQELNY